MLPTFLRAQRKINHVCILRARLRSSPLINWTRLWIKLETNDPEIILPICCVKENRLTGPFNGKPDVMVVSVCPSTRTSVSYFGGPDSDDNGWRKTVSNNTNLELLCLQTKYEGLTNLRAYTLSTVTTKRKKRYWTQILQCEKKLFENIYIVIRATTFSKLSWVTCMKMACGRLAYRVNCKAQDEGYFTTKLFEYYRQHIQCDCALHQKPQKVTSKKYGWPAISNMFTLTSRFLQVTLNVKNKRTNGRTTSALRNANLFLHNQDYYISFFYLSIKSSIT